MNQFKQIKQRQQATPQERMQTNVIQAHFNLNELKKRAIERENKESYTFKLYPSDRKKIDQLAIEFGYQTPSGKPNASAFLTMLIQMMAEMND